MNSPALSVEKLCCRFGAKEVLHNLTFEIERGGMYAVMGKNGSGKSTLLRCLAHLIEPTSGSVRLEGRDIGAYSVRTLAQRLSLVRQQADAAFEFSALDIVLMGRHPYQHRLQNESQHDYDIARHYMELTHTWQLRHVSIQEMSGGERQRVMIARALTQDTPIMLLDEPTSNLDIAHQFDIMQMLTEINRKQGKTVIIVMHDLNLAYRYCPSLLLLHNHGVCYQGPTREGLTPERVNQVFGIDYPFLCRE